MEEAEHQLLRHVGLSVVSQIEGKTVSWPRVAARCDYRKAIKFEQMVNIAVSIERLGNRSITYHFRFTDEAGQTVAEGSTTAVCCEIPPQHDLHQPLKPLPVDIPGQFRDKLQVYLSTN
jgi:4-hydroxybenzoyl-CoA thioesterase/acyl-CoA thioester hydrolase